jgi:hypothetical protein
MLASTKTRFNPLIPGRKSWDYSTKHSGAQRDSYSLAHCHAQYYTLGAQAKDSLRES